MVDACLMLSHESSTVTVTVDTVQSMSGLPWFHIFHVFCPNYKLISTKYGNFFTIHMKQQYSLVGL